VNSQIRFAQVSSQNKVSVPASAECSAWHLKLTLCSSCRAHHCVSSHGSRTSPLLATLLEMQEVEKKSACWPAQILFISEN